ncbi:MAG: winged helix-turn-helix transcriptional regulator [Hadesarchaea archaeon]|nr:winged helix-turn-helix transcriptional regulator [Hadesarchaea archaeon]
MMKEEKIYEKHSNLCKMLSNPLRLKILHLLREGENSVGQITSQLDARQPTVSQHLSMLRKLGLVSSRRDGKKVYYKIKHPKIMKACDLIQEVVFEQLSEDQDLVKGGGSND